MATCEVCKQEMNTADGCVDGTLYLTDGTTVFRSRTHWCDSGGRWTDCGAKHGQPHHLGCDVERCPYCMGQLISCGCLARATFNLPTQKGETDQNDNL